MDKVYDWLYKLPNYISIPLVLSFCVLCWSIFFAIIF